MSQLQPNTFKLPICKITIDAVQIYTRHTCHDNKIDIAARERKCWTLWLGNMIKISWTTINICNFLNKPDLFQPIPFCILFSYFDIMYPEVAWVYTVAWVRQMLYNHSAGLLYLLMTNFEHDLFSIVHVASQGQDMSLCEFEIGDFRELLFDQNSSISYRPETVGEVKCPRRHGERWLMGEMIVCGWRGKRKERGGSRERESREVDGKMTSACSLSVI